MEIQAPHRRNRVRLTSRSPSVMHRLRRRERFAALDTLHKRDGLALRPAAVVSIGLSQEGAMTAMLRLEIGDVRIPPQFLASFGQHANERIVVGMQNERG